MKKYLPVIVCGFGAAVLNIIPGIKNFGCCLFIPLAAAFSVYLFKKTNFIEGNIKASTGLVFGFLTGLTAAFFASSFDILITFISRTNEFVESLPQSEEVLRDFNLGPLMEETLSMMKQIATDIKRSGFSPFYAVGIFLSNIFSYSIFGIIGGLLGVLFFNKKSRT